MSDPKDLPPTLRRCARVVRMVHELHKRGFQQVRIVPYWRGSAWQITITHAGNIFTWHGAAGEIDKPLVTAQYTSDQENEYFGWTDAKTDTASALAEKFMVRVPHVIHLGIGRDWVYAGWYQEMMRFAARGELPVAAAPFPILQDPRFLPTLCYLDSGLPMPPGGELWTDDVLPPPMRALDPDGLTRTIPFAPGGRSDSLIELLSCR